MRLIVGISGASGVIMGYHLVKAIHENSEAEVHLVMTESAKLTWELETDLPIHALIDEADVTYDSADMAASVSSGTFSADGMIVLPCSMKTLAGIVTGYSDNLLLRAADVTLKEGRMLVLCPREMPLSRVHLRNLKEAADVGCTIIPPMLSFYQKPESLEDQINHVIGKILMQFDIVPKNFKAWK